MPRYSESVKRFLRGLGSVLLIFAGFFSAAFGLKGFLLSSHFIDGGVTGISMLLSEIFKKPLSIFILVINLPFVAIGYRQIGRAFAIKSVLSIAGLALVLAFVEFPDITPDKLLTAAFGGFFIGAGIGLAIRGGAVLDGTEIAALLVSRTSSLLNVGDVILILNTFIFLAAAFVLGVDSQSISQRLDLPLERIVHPCRHVVRVGLQCDRLECFSSTLVPRVFGWW